MTEAAESYHVNPDTGLPNRCLDGADCTYGGSDFHYPNKHDANIAWRARQLERGIIAYRRVMQAKEKEQEEAALARWAGTTKRYSKKLSLSVFRWILVRNIARYVANLLGLAIAYSIASGKWLTDDWIRHLLPTLASIVVVALVVWFAVKFAHGGKKAAVAVKKRRLRQTGPVWPS